MKELEIDEDMFEEDKINRFLNMIATQYDGNLATQYASSYLKKCNELDKYKKVLDKIKEYVENLLKEEFEITDPDNINYGEKCQRAYFSDSELEKILELLEEIE